MSPYTPQTWHNVPAVDTPISAARLTVMENGIAAAALATDVAVVREAPLNVMDIRFGAVGNDTGNQAAAIQAAEDLAEASGGGEVLIPPGNTFRTTDQINHKDGVKLRGGGITSVINYTGSGHALLFGAGNISAPGDLAWTGLQISDLKITGTSSGLSGIRIRGVTRYSIDNVTASGFSTGAGILLNGCSFIGRIHGGRMKGNKYGISAQKVLADGSAGEGQAFNAIVIDGQCEIQNNEWGILIGDPATTETGPVVGMGASITDCTIEGNSVGGIWNVAGNKITIRDNYLEGNTTCDIRVGSTSGNISVPVLCKIDANFIYTTAISLDILRSLACRIRDNYLLADVPSTTSGIVIAANAQHTVVGDNYQVNVDTPFTNGSSTTVYETGDSSIRRVEAAAVTTTGDANIRASDFGQVSIGRAGPGNEAGFRLGSTADTQMYRGGSGVSIGPAGKGWMVKEGTNAMMGVATLVAGTVVVSTTVVTANSRVFLTCQTPGGTPGFLRVSARTAGTSFTILSSSGTDTSVVAWLIVEPA